MQRKLFAVTDMLSYRSPKLVRYVLQMDNGSTYPICPRCGKTMDREYQSYCDRCGQALDWKGFSKAAVIVSANNKGVVSK